MTTTDEKRARDVNKLTLWMERHPDIEKLDALWCCEGAIEGVGYAFYVAVVLARADYGPGPRVLTAEFRATSPMALVFQMEQAGLETPPWEEVRRLCESAGANPKLSRRTRAANDAAFASGAPDDR